MTRKVAVLALALALCATVAGAGDKTKGKATVEGSSLQVSKKLDQKNYPYSGSVNVSALVSYPGKQILVVDTAASKVTELKDDKGTDFLKSSGFFKPSFNQQMMAKDRASVVVGTGSYGVGPVGGATKIILKGSVVLICGQDEKTTEAKEVEIKNNTEVKFDDFTLKVYQEKGFAGSGGSFNISSTKPTFKSVTVTDADGKTVEVRPGFFFGPPSFTPNKTYGNAFNLAKPVTKVKVKITYFTKEEKVTVPVDLALGAGL